MPNTGGRCSSCLPGQSRAMAIVNRRRTDPVRHRADVSVRLARRPAAAPAPRSACSAAGTSKLTTDGTKRRKKSKKSTTPACQTISVVMSPNGLNAPPAFAATTMLMKAIATKRGLPPPTAITTAPMTSAVVRLSRHRREEEREQPVTQNSWR